MQNFTLETLWSVMILLPGIVWSLIWMKYSKNKPQTDKFYFIVYSIFASAPSYFACFWFYYFFSDLDENNFIEILNNVSADWVRLKFIFFSTIVSIVFGFCWVYLSHNDPIIKLMQKLNISLSDGEADVLTSSIHKHMMLGEKGLIRLYDFDNNKIYQGKISQISEPKQEMEFILNNCEIYDNINGEFLLFMKKIYLNLNPKNILIEFIII
jgi:hypothetical protein